MPFDDHANFAYSLVAAAPSPAGTGTSLVVTAGQGALFPRPPFNVTIWPTATQPLASNAEVARCTAVVTDTLTLIRNVEGSTARNVIVGDQIAATITDKNLTDAEVQFHSGNQTIASVTQAVPWHVGVINDERLTLTGSGRLVVFDSVPLLPTVQAYNYAQDVTIADEQFIDQYAHFKLTGNERLTIQGTGRLVLLDFTYPEWTPTQRVLTVGTGVYHPPPTCTAFIFEGVAGGGGGGGASGSASNVGAAQGGGASGYGRKLFTAPASAYAYTVGALGTGGTGGTPNNGNSGTDTTFSAGASLVTIKAGAGGQAMAFGTAATIAALTGTGGAAGTGGDINAGGAPGQPGIRLSGTVGVNGSGGSSYMGGGGFPRNTQGTANATAYGSGGAGALSTSANTNGGDGTDGVIVITEFYT